MKRGFRVKLLVFVLAWVTVCGLSVFLSSCDYISPGSEVTETKAVKLALAEDPGIEWAADNVLCGMNLTGIEDRTDIEWSAGAVTECRAGPTYQCAYRLKDGYVITGIDGAEFKDGTAVTGEGVGIITVGPLYYPTTVILKTRPLRDCEISCAVSDGEDGNGGSVTATETNVREGTPVTLTATAAEQFGFAGYSENLPVCSGGIIISSSAVYDYTPSDSVTVYANFTREYATIRLEDSPGLIIKANNEVTARVGQTAFFAIGLEEGYVIDSLDEGMTLEGTLVYIPITGPRSYTVHTRPLDKYAFQISVMPYGGGTVTKEPDRSFGYDGETVKLKASAADGYVFTGYTQGASLPSGGKLLSADAEYSLELKENTYLVANFELKTWKVTLKAGNGCTVTGLSELTVSNGSSADFTVSIDPDYVVYEISGGAVYDEKTGKISFANVKADTVIEIKTRKLDDVYFSCKTNNELYGSVKTSLPEGWYAPGTKVTLTAVDGYSAFLRYEAGGKVISSSRTYTLTLKEGSSEISAVFDEPDDPALTVTVPADRWVLLYHPNGGKITGSKELYKTEYFSNKYYHCPNTLPDMGYFTREGYILIGYNTKSDGSGTYYGPGWNVVMPERGAISLYCVWAKESAASDFTYTVGVSTADYKYSKTNILKTGTKCVTITGYTGKDKTVVIPEKIDGMYVTAIAGGAIRYSDLETLIFPKTMQSVAASSVISCTKLKKVYAFDGITSMPDNWYSSNCTEVQQFFVLAQKMPTYCSSRNGTYAIKFEWLMTAPGNKIVIVSGSNSAYGINSPLLAQKLAAAGYNYSIVNYGQNAGTAACFYIEVISHFIKEGDILLHEPEFTNNYQFGNNTINTTLWQIFEGAYDAFSLVDTRHYVKLYSTFAAFNKTTASRTPLKYETFTSETVNAYGDFSKQKNGTVVDTATALDTYEAGDGVYSYKSSVSLITANTAYTENGRTLKYRDELNRAYDLIYAAKGKVLFSMCAVAELVIKEEERPAGCEGQKLYMNAIDTLLHCERISVPSRYFFNRKYIYNSVYHVNTAGQTLRTGYLAEDLIAYFKK